MHFRLPQYICLDVPARTTQPKTRGPFRTRPSLIIELEAERTQAGVTLNEQPKSKTMGAPFHNETFRSTALKLHFNEWVWQQIKLRSRSIQNTNAARNIGGERSTKHANTVDSWSPFLSYCPVRFSHNLNTWKEGLLIRHVHCRSVCVCVKTIT